MITSDFESQPTAAEEALFQCLEAEDRERELAKLHECDPVLEQETRQLLVRLERQGLLTESAAEGDVPEQLGPYRIV